MGSAYQSVAKAVQKELDRIRQEASAISESARESLDHDINIAVGEVINDNDQVKRAIETALKQLIVDWDAS